jgi:uncharacterized OB-fold protein
MLRKEYSLNLDYSASFGDTYSKFMRALMEKKLIGNRCEKCGRLYVPVRPFCDFDFFENSEPFEVDPTGKVVAFTVYYIKSANLPDPPFIQGIINIADAANSFLHFIDGIECQDPNDLPNKIKIGMQVKPVWADKRKGDILDLAYFTPT